MIACTTFPPWAWDVYAKQAIESFLRFWPIPILIYYESPPPLSNDRVGVRPLDEIEDRTKFLNMGVTPAPPDHYMFDAKRFCHKVFSQLDALKDNDNVIWLDADVVTHKTVPMEVVEFISSAELTYLGRKGNYTETGFIGFNNASGQIDDFIERYITGLRLEEENDPIGRLRAFCAKPIWSRPHCCGRISPRPDLWTGNEPEPAPRGGLDSGHLHTS